MASSIMSFAIIFLGLCVKLKSTVCANAKTLEAIQYIPIPTGNRKVKYVENKGMPNVMQPMAGFFAISGFVCFCLNQVKTPVAREEMPERMGTTHNLSNTFWFGVFPKSKPKNEKLKLEILLMDFAEVSLKSLMILLTVAVLKLILLLGL